MSEYRNLLLSTLTALKDREPLSESHREFILRSLYSVWYKALELDDMDLVVECQKAISKLEVQS